MSYDIDGLDPGDDILDKLTEKLDDLNVPLTKLNGDNYTITLKADQGESKAFYGRLARKQRSTCPRK